MAEMAFLTAVGTFLTQQAQVHPKPVQAGMVEPESQGEMPAVVLALEEIRRGNNGLGGRSTTIRQGVLPWEVRIDLAQPTLPDDPALSLLSPDRQWLTLPHGGQVRQDGSPGALTAADLVITLDGNPLPVVLESPQPGELLFEVSSGRVQCAEGFATSGELTIQYWLGQWEQRTIRLSGKLRADVCTLSLADCLSLSADLTSELLEPRTRRLLPGLLAVHASEVGPVGIPGTAPHNGRRRTLKFLFDYEHLDNRPDSSGGPIRSIHVSMHVPKPSTDPQNGNPEKVTEVTVIGVP